MAKQCINTETMEEFAQLKSDLESALKNVQKLELKELKTKDELTKLNKDYDKLKEDLGRNKEKRERLEKQMESLKKELRLEKSENESLRRENRELRKNNKDNRKSVDRDQPRKRSRSSSRDRSEDLCSCLSGWDGNCGCSAFSGKRRRHEMYKTERHDRHGSIEFEKLEGIKPLGDDEFKEEMKERHKRSKQMLVCDLSSKLDRTLESIRKLVKDEMHIDVKWKLVNLKSETDVIVEVENFEDKMDLIRERNWFKNFHELYFLDYKTTRQQEIHDGLKRLARKERAKGNLAKVRFMKIIVNNTWKVWNEKNARLEFMRDRKY